MKKLSTKKSTRTLCYDIRAAMDMSQVDFAKEVGVSEKTIANWETGSVQPSGAAMTVLCILQKKILRR